MDAPPAPPALRSILRSASSNWARRAAQRDALLAGLHHELVLKVLVLGGDGVGKSSLVHMLATGGATTTQPPPSEPTRGLESTTVRVATLDRGAPVFIQFCEAPLSVLRAPSHIRVGERPASGTALQSHIAFSGVHAAMLLLDGGDDPGDDAHRSLAAVDWLRDALESNVLSRLLQPARAPGRRPFPVFLVAHGVRAAILQCEDDTAVLGGGLSIAELRSYAAAAGFTGGLWLSASHPPVASPRPKATEGGQGAPGGLQRGVVDAGPVAEHSPAAAALRQAATQRLLDALVDSCLSRWGGLEPTAPPTDQPVFEACELRLLAGVEGCEGGESAPPRGAGGVTIAQTV